LFAAGRNPLSAYAGDVKDPARLVLDFLNTLEVDDGTDHLATREGYLMWLAARGLPADPADPDAEHARAVRAVLRGAVAGDRPPADALTAVTLRLDLDRDGHPALTGEGPLGRIVAAAAELVYDGRWARIKLCGADDCRWAFYDQSRNRSGRWCSMAVCGNRAKSRAFRARH
jgi:predicted RNA-binding Zn ribbon-like protein